MGGSHSKQLKHGNQVIDITACYFYKVRTLCKSCICKKYNLFTQT